MTVRGCASAPSGRGLRERKKAQTRQSIIDAATRLFDAQGYNETTLAEITEAAEISASTFFNYFGSKADIVFGLLDTAIESARERVLGRPPEESASHAILAWLAEDVPAVERPWAEAMQRIPRIIESDPELVAGRRLRHAILEDVVAEAFARDFDEGAARIGGRLMAAIAMQTIGDVWRAWYEKHAADSEFDASRVLPLKVAHLERALQVGLRLVESPSNTLIDV